MKQATIAVEVVGEYESSFRLRLKTGYGDPVILVHKDAVKLEDAKIPFRCSCGPFGHKDPSDCANAMRNARYDKVAP